MSRKIALDTETTGLYPDQGDRIVEIAAIEIIDRKLTSKRFHHVINPGRKIPKRATEIHGITDEQVRDKPLFSEIAGELIRFVDGAELIIHNAPFDLGFLRAELDKTEYKKTQFNALDTLQTARDAWPGEKNSLDAVCDRLGVDRSRRDREGHGALLDTELLAKVYLKMTEPSKPEKQKMAWYWWVVIALFFWWLLPGDGGVIR